MAGGLPGEVGIIVLAAGRGRRFGADKRQARLAGGATLLDGTLSRIPPSLPRRLLVLRPGDEALATRYREQGWRICIAADAEQGMGHSLAAAIREVDDWRGALVALGDMPWVRAQTYELLRREVEEESIVLPLYQGRRGNPAGFGRRYFGEIAALQGDQGARGLLQAHADRVRPIETGDPGILRDVDTPEGLSHNPPP